MPEGWVAHIVCQTSRTYDGTDFFEQRVAQFGMALNQGASHIVAQRHAHRGHFKAMCKAVVHEYTARQGEHLRLVLQSSERSRED